MVPAIHDRLKRWAAWSRTDPTRTGYQHPVTSRDYRAPNQEGCREKPITSDDEEAEETESAIRRLCETHRRVIIAVYTQPGDPEQWAAEMGISVRQLWRDRDSAHRMLQDILCARSKVSLDMARETLLF